MFIWIQIFFCAFSALMLMLLYLPFYIRTRRAEKLKKTIKDHFQPKLLLCFGFNVLLCAGLFMDSLESSDIMLAILLMMIVDFDLMICRIPTEFLILLYAVLLPDILLHTNLLNVTICLVVWSFWWIGWKKRMIALYDVWIILPLTLYLNDISKILIFYAVFLILWGCVGLILRYFFRKSPDTRIPLSPLILSAFLLIRLFP